MKTSLENPKRLDEHSRLVQLQLEKNRFSPLCPSLSRYNITISDNYRFIWFRVPKVATRSIYNYLKNEKVGLSAEHPFNVYYPINYYHNYFKFAFVRNPWDRLVSCWKNKVVKNNHFGFDETEYKKMRSFKEFVTLYVSSLNLNECDSHLRLQTKLIDLNQIDFLGRFESLDDDFKEICKVLKLPVKQLLKFNVSQQKKNYKEYYDPELINKVYELYQKDIRILGYQF